MHFDSRVVQGWIALQHTDEKSPDYERLFEFWDTVSDLVHERPDAAWLFVLEVLKADTSNTIMENLSAGPLEDLLAQHGPKLIERVEVEARANPKFAYLLGGVWKNAMSEEIWQRVQKVQDRRGWDGIPAA